MKTNPTYFSIVWQYFIAPLFKILCIFAAIIFLLFLVGNPLTKLRNEPLEVLSPLLVFVISQLDLTLRQLGRIKWTSVSPLVMGTIRWIVGLGLIALLFWDIAITEFITTIENINFPLVLIALVPISLFAFIFIWNNKREA